MINLLSFLFLQSQRGDAHPPGLFDWGLTCLFSIKGDNEPTGGRLTLGPKHRPALVRTGVRGGREWRRADEEWRGERRRRQARGVKYRQKKKQSGVDGVAE